MIALDIVSLRSRSGGILALAAAGLLLLPGSSEAWQRRGNPVRARLRPGTWRQNQTRYRPQGRPVFQRQQNCAQQPSYQGRPAYQAASSGTAAGAAGAFALTEAEYDAMQQASLPATNYAQSGNYRIETIPVGDRKHQYWLKWEGGRITAYELAGGHMTGRYRYFSNNEEFYGWRQGIQKGGDFSAWSGAWDGSRYSQGLASSALQGALGQYRANPPEPEAELPPEPEVYEDDTLEADVEAPEEEPASPSDLVADAGASGVFGLPGEPDAEEEAQPQVQVDLRPAGKPDATPVGEVESSPSDRPPMEEDQALEDEVEPYDPFADPALAALRDQIATASTREEEIDLRLRWLAGSEGPLFRERNALQEKLSHNPGSAIRRADVRRRRQSWRDRVEAIQAQVGENQKEREALQRELRNLRSARQRDEASLGQELLQEDAPEVEDPRVVELRAEVQEMRTRQGEIGDRLSAIATEEYQAIKSRRALDAQLARNPGSSIRKPEVRRRRQALRDRRDQLEAKITAFGRERSRLQAEFRSLRTRLQQSEAELGRSMLPN